MDAPRVRATVRLLLPFYLSIVPNAILVAIFVKTINGVSIPIDMIETMECIADYKNTSLLIDTKSLKRVCAQTHRLY